MLCSQDTEGRIIDPYLDECPYSDSFVTQV